MRNNITKSIGEHVSEIIAQERKIARKEIHIGQSARVEYRRGARNPDGSVDWFNNGEWDHNLILDSGLDSVASRFWVENIAYGVAGTGTNPVERDSGATTFTASAGTVTASANFFEAADANRLLVLDDGSQGYITAYTSPTQVTWNGPDVAVGSQGGVFYVNRTALQTEVKRTSTYRTSTGDNGSTWSAVNGEWEFKRTFLFSTESGSVTYKEIGWSWGTTGTALFGMDVFSGGGDALVSGQQYLIQVKLVLRISPALAAVAAPDVGSGGWNTEGDIVLNSVGTDTSNAFPAFASIQTTGVRYGSYGGLEPCHVQDQEGRNQMTFATANFTLGTAATAGGVADVTGITKSTGASSYVTGSFTRTHSASLSVSEANGLIYGITKCAGFTSNRVMAVKFDTPQTKDNVHTVKAYFRYTWNRRF